MESNFVLSAIRKDSNRPFKFRFPPEPNGYLHLGHAKSICLNYGLTEEFEGSTCHLRFDDTNPSTEDQEYIDSIKEDLKWLGFLTDDDTIYYSSDNFERLYQLAIQLIKEGKAYICDLGPDELREYRGDVTTPGRPCKGRKRDIDENLSLFHEMRQGEFREGTRTLRAKIDLTSSNMNLRDPIMYRINKSKHHRTGEEWCIYPSYDWAHGLCDYFEGITHSICTIEYENHRPLYDWFLDNLGINHPRPRQIEFAPLSVSHTVLSKRKLKELVDTGKVGGWDDPRMPTLSGLRRRGITPRAIKAFCATIGVTKVESLVSFGILENYVRDELNNSAPRRMAVMNPLKLVIDNYPESIVELVNASNHPLNSEFGVRRIPFTKELWIEREDFREEAPKKYFRLKPGQEVRLRYAYYVTCTSCDKDPETGEITTVHATYDPATKGGSDPGGRKVKGTIHWVSARYYNAAELRLYKPLFTDEDMNSSMVKMSKRPWLDRCDPNSLEVYPNAKVEARMSSLVNKAIKNKEQMYWQFERQGYFCVDLEDSTNKKPVFNRVVGLKDTWSKIEKKS